MDLDYQKRCQEKQSRYKETVRKAIEKSDTRSPPMWSWSSSRSKCTTTNKFLFNQKKLQCISYKVLCLLWYTSRANATSFDNFYFRFAKKWQRAAVGLVCQRPNYSRRFSQTICLWFFWRSRLVMSLLPSADDATNTAVVTDSEVATMATTPETNSPKTNGENM